MSEITGESPLTQFLDENDPISEKSFTDGIPSGNDEEAGRMLRTLATLEAQIETNTALATRERQKITDWEASVNQPLQQQAVRLRNALEGYAIAERHRDEKTRKTISTPFGVLKTLPAQPKWIIVDEAAVVEWAEQAQATHLIAVKKTVKLAEVKKDLLAQDGEAIDAETAEAVPGIKIMAPDQPFTATIKTA